MKTNPSWNSSFTSQLLYTLSKLITSLSLSVFTCKNGDGDTYCIVFSGELCFNNKYKVHSTVTEKKTNVNSLPPKRVILDGWMDEWVNGRMDGWMDGSQLRAPSRLCCSGSHGISTATRILPCGSLLLVMAPGPHRKGRAARVAPSWAEHPATPSPRPLVCL